MKVEPSHPLYPSQYEKRDVEAIQALLRGDASEAQQKRVLDFIINNLCKTYDEPYRDDDRATTFALGKAHVGREIVKFTKLKLGNLK